MNNHILIGCLILSVIVVILLFKYRRITIPFIYVLRKTRWKLGTIVTTDPLAVEVSGIKSLDSNELGIFPECVFMADPFIINDKGIFYIFYEHASSTINNPGADLWALCSNDFKSWKSLGPVLKEQFHLSFPNVFNYEDQWYMLPETNASGQLRLYSTDKFPYKWKLKTVLLENIIASDPVFIRIGNMNYILFQNNSDYSLRLYISHKIECDWKEHPASPIRVNNNDTRPGGTIGYVDGNLIYFIQNHSEGYGTGIIVYQINEISPDTFKDRRLDKNPLLWKNGLDWMSAGMHHFSWLKLENEYFCVTDGKQKVKREFKFSLRNFPHIRI